MAFMKTAAVTLFVALVVVGFVVLIRHANDRVEPNGPPATERSVDGYYYPRYREGLDDVAILFYGEARYRHFLLQINKERGILENSSIPPGTWIFVPGAIQHLEMLGNPVDVATNP